MTRRVVPALVASLVVFALTAPGIAQAVGGSGIVSDFDGDGFADQAVGASGDRIGGHGAAGSVTVLYGSVSRLTTTGAQRFTADTASIVGASGDGFRFGATLAPGDFNGDGYSDLAIGSPGESIRGHAGAGAVHVLYGSSTGLDAAGNQRWSGCGTE